MPRSSVTIELTAKDIELQKAIGRVKSSISNLATSITRNLKRASVAFIGLGIWAIKTASTSEETASKFDVVFGRSAAAMEKWGDGLAKQFQRSKGEVAGFLASTQDLLVPLGLAEDAAMRMSKQIVTLAFDLGSFNDLADPRVLNDLQVALTGSGEVMKKYGVIVNETTLKQQLLNEGIDPKHVTEAQKAQARFNIILKGTEKAQGDVMRTSESFANRLKALKARFTELRVEIGEKLMPVAQRFLTVLNNVISFMGAEAIITTGKWVVGLTAVVIVIPKVIAVLGTMAAILKVVTGAQTVLLALSGPAGWAVLVAGAAIALAAIKGLEIAWDKVGKAAKGAQAASGETVEAMGKGGGGFTLEQVARGKELMKMFPGLKPVGTESSSGRLLDPERATAGLAQREERAKAGGAGMGGSIFLTKQFREYLDGLRSAAGVAEDREKSEAAFGEKMKRDEEERVRRSEIADREEALRVAEFEAGAFPTPHAAAEDRKRGFTAAFESAEQMYRRIAGAAAGRTPEDRTAKGVETIVEQRQQFVTQLRDFQKEIKAEIRALKGAEPLKAIVVGAQ